MPEVPEYQGSRTAPTAAAVPPDWPNRAASRMVTAGGLTWHVQDMGTGPTVLLIHGTGSASHTWRDVMPLLATRFRVVAPDLPGHGFTSSPPFAGFSLPAMAASLRDLLADIGVSPAIVVGHSAGAAVLVRMTLSHYIAPRALVSINGALLPLSGLPRWLFSPLAKVLARSSRIPRWAAGRAGNPAAIRRLIDDTGSKLDATGLRLYQHLVQRSEHVAAALAMMANWDLDSLVTELGRLRTPLKLLVASRDRTITPATAERVQAFIPTAEVISLGDYGHLAHEEIPQAVAEEIVRLAREGHVQLSSGTGPPQWRQYLMQS